MSGENGRLRAALIQSRAALDRAAKLNDELKNRVAAADGENSRLRDALVQSRAALDRASKLNDELKKSGAALSSSNVDLRSLLRGASLVSGGRRAPSDLEQLGESWCGMICSRIVAALNDLASCSSSKLIRGDERAAYLIVRAAEEATAIWYCRKRDGEGEFESLASLVDAMLDIAASRAAASMSAMEGIFVNFAASSFKADEDLAVRFRCAFFAAAERRAFSPEASKKTRKMYIELAVRVSARVVYIEDGLWILCRAALMRSGQKTKSAAPQQASYLCDLATLLQRAVAATETGAATAADKNEAEKWRGHLDVLHILLTPSLHDHDIDILPAMVRREAGRATRAIFKLTAAVKGLEWTYNAILSKVFYPMLQQGSDSMPSSSELTGFALEMIAQFGSMSSHAACRRGSQEDVSFTIRKRIRDLLERYLNGELGDGSDRVRWHACCAIKRLELDSSKK